MRKIVFLLLCGVATVTVAEAQNFSIKGVLSDVRNDTLEIQYVKREPEKEIVVVKVQVDGEGRFSYACPIKYACYAAIKRMSDQQTGYFFFVPGERAEISGRFDFVDGWQIAGTPFYCELADVKRMLMPFYEGFREAGKAFREGLAAGGDRVHLDSLRTAANRTINRNMRDVVAQHVERHPDRESSATLVLNVNYTDVLSVIRMLSPEVRTGRFKVYLDGIEKMFSQLMKEVEAGKKATLELAERRPAPDFTLKDLDGRDFRLSDLFGKGRYVVVDFWGSWCSWCIQGFPRMAEYYNRYRDRLDIVGVACHDKEPNWKRAVARHEAPWYHVLSEDGTVEVRYGVTGYPYKVIIAPNGKVLRVFRGETEEFYQLLDEWLQR